MELSRPCGGPTYDLLRAKQAPLLPSQTSRVAVTRGGFWVALAALLAAVAKTLIAWNTIGTNDVLSFYQFGAALQKHGLEWTYAHDLSFNHPPVIAWFLVGIYKASHMPLLQENRLTFPLLLRFPGIVADLTTVLTVFHISQSLQRKVPTWALLLFALSPVSLMITGFHGNTDPIMTMFFTLAVLAAVRARPILCGLFLGLSCQIKIIPLLFLPIFLFWWTHRHAALKFAIPVTVTFLVLWSQPLFQFPLIFTKRVLSYGSFWGLWGITYWLRQTGLAQFSRVTYYDFTRAENVVSIALKLLIIAAVFLIAVRRRSGGEVELLCSLAYGWLVFFVFSPGVCAQYLVWLSPFILFLSPGFFAWFTGTSSLFLFFFYNSIADRFPWYFGLSYGAQDAKWAPWAAWPWAILIAGMVVLWFQAKRSNSSLRLFSFKLLTPEVV